MATQEKTWNVANRLHSLKDSDNPEVNHIIAGADEIYDDAKGAKQSDINAQTDAAIADRYTKAQVDAAIDAIDVSEQLADYAKKTEVSTAVSAETARAQGVEATKANASEVATALAAKQNVLTFDNTPTDGSTNPVTSGGVKAAIDAIDVSEQLENVAFLGEDEGQAVIPEFDPQTDTLLKTTQSLTNTEKETVIGNILDKNYIAGSYVGKGKKYLKLNVGAPVATDFDGFVDGATTEQSSLAEVPDNIYFDRTNNRFIASKGEGLLMKYYMSWQNGDAYMNPNSGVYFKNGNDYYQWNGTTLEAATVGNVNKLTQADLNTENTIYVIRYDFDLCGQSITIPEGCILEFDGGSLSNGTLVGNNTDIQAKFVKIFNTDVTIAGSWNVRKAYPIWFGAKGNGTDDDYSALNNCNIVGRTIDITWNGENTEYYISQALYLTKSIIGNKETISKLGDGSLVNSVIIISQQSEITVENISIDGKWDSTDDTSSGEHSHGINIIASDNITIKNCHIKNNKGDNIYVGSPGISYICTKINIKDCYLENPYRCCVSIITADGVNISNNICKHSSSYVAVIDLERNDDSTEQIRNVSIKDNSFYADSNVSVVALNNRVDVVEDSPQQYENIQIIGNNVYTCRSFVQAARSFTNNLIISNNNVRITPLESHNYNFFLEISNAKNIIVSNNNVVIYTHISYILGASNVKFITFSDNIFTSKSGTYDNFSIFRTIEKLSIVNNSFYDISCNVGSVQLVEDLSNVAINGNYFNNSAGIYIKKSSVTDISILDNITTRQTLLTINSMDDKVNVNMFGNVSTASVRRLVSGLGQIKYNTHFQSRLNKSYSRCIYGNEPPAKGLFSSGSVCFNTDAQPASSKPIFAWVNNVDASTEETTLTWEPVTVNSNRCTTANRPSGQPIGYHVYDTDLNREIYWTGTRWIQHDGATAGVLRSGTFANKPDAGIYTGFKYFCTDRQTAEGQTDGIEIIYKGNNVWVDALGRTIS